MKKKQEKIETKGSEMKREMGKIRKVFKKTKDVGLAEHKITSIPGKKTKLPIEKIKSVIERAR